MPIATTVTRAPRLEEGIKDAREVFGPPSDSHQGDRGTFVNKLERGWFATAAATCSI
jgi:hypothetical protein